jgi:hypothetical protein
VTQNPRETAEPGLLHILQPDEELAVQARAMDGLVAGTNRRLVVTSEGRIRLDVAYEEVRRVQFDIERGRPATLVIVPDEPSHPPEVLAIPASEYENAARLLAIVGLRISQQA